MKRTFALASLAVAAAMIGGCASTETDANKPRADVMDLNDPSPSKVPTAPPSQPQPAPVAEAASTPEPPAAAGPRKHVVAAKDTLYALATKYYGDSKQWPKILKANPGLVPEHMPVGKAIVIP